MGTWRGGETPGTIPPSRPSTQSIPPFAHGPPPTNTPRSDLFFLPLHFLLLSFSLFLIILPSSRLHRLPIHLLSLAGDTTHSSAGRPSPALHPADASSDPMSSSPPSSRLATPTSRSSRVRKQVTHYGSYMDSDVISEEEDHIDVVADEDESFEDKVTKGKESDDAASELDGLGGSEDEMNLVSGETIGWVLMGDRSLRALRRGRSPGRRGRGKRSRRSRPLRRRPLSGRRGRRRLRTTKRRERRLGLSFSVRRPRGRW